MVDEDQPTEMKEPPGNNIPYEHEHVKQRLPSREAWWLYATLLSSE
jgi:hypothetical protein